MDIRLNSVSNQTQLPEEIEVAPAATAQSESGQRELYFHLYFLLFRVLLAIGAIVFIVAKIV